MAQRTFFEDLTSFEKQNKQMRVVGYCRVSTRHEEQLASLDAQEKAIKDFCKKYNLTLVENFVEVISGKSNLREEYSKMINLIKSQNVDYVLVKDDTRLNRSNENTNAFIRYLRKNNVKAYFLMSNMTLDPCDNDDVFHMQINSVLGERYVREQSAKAHYAHKKKCDEKRLSRQNECYGFKFNSETQQMEIDPFEGEIIKKIFEMYVYQDMGSTTISKKLYDYGVCGFGNSLYITPQAILKYLRNTAYIGKMTFNHYNMEFEVGESAKSKRVYNSKEDYVVAQVPPIISKELFELAQRKLEYNNSLLLERYPNARSTNTFKGLHLFAHKIVCGSCGTYFTHKLGGKTNRYHYYYDSQRDRVRRKDKSKNINEKSEICSCKNEYTKIREDVLISIVSKAISLSEQEKDFCFENIKKALRFATSNSSKPKCNLLNELEKKYKKHEKTFNSYLERMALVDVSLVEHFNQLALKEKEIMQNILLEIDKEKSHIDKLDNISDKMEEVEKKLNELKSLKEISRELVCRYVDIIKVNEDGSIDITLNFGNTLSFEAHHLESVPTQKVVNTLTLGVPYSSLEAYPRFPLLDIPLQ